MKKGERCPSEKLVEYCVNRDLGKTPDRHEILEKTEEFKPFAPGERELLSGLAKRLEIQDIDGMATSINNARLLTMALPLSATLNSSGVISTAWETARKFTAPPIQPPV